MGKSRRTRWAAVAQAIATPFNSFMTILLSVELHQMLLSKVAQPILSLQCHAVLWSTKVECMYFTHEWIPGTCTDLPLEQLFTHKASSSCILTFTGPQCFCSHCCHWLQVEQAAAEVLECSDAWRKGSATAKPASSILRLLGALDELPAAAMLNASYAQEG